METPQPATPAPFLIDVDFKEIIVLLANEMSDIPPLVKFVLSGTPFQGNFQRSVYQRLTVKGSYYNLQKALWEPLLEPWTFSFLVCRTLLYFLSIV